MFKVSTKGDYGLLVLSALAQAAQAKNAASAGATAKTEFVPLKTIADEKHLSLSYVSQIIVPLKQACLVESKEGREGGYRLAKDPHEISLLEVLEVLEGPVAPVKCCAKSALCACEPQCKVKNTWRQAQSLLKDFLENRTLADMIHN